MYIVIYYFDIKKYYILYYLIIFFFGHFYIHLLFSCIKIKYIIMHDINTLTYMYDYMIECINIFV